MPLFHCDITEFQLELVFQVFRYRVADLLIEATGDRCKGFLIEPKSNDSLTFDAASNQEREGVHVALALFLEATFLIAEADALRADPRQEHFGGWLFAESKEGTLLVLLSAVHAPMQKGRVFVRLAPCPKRHLPHLVTSYTDAVRQRAFERSRSYAVVFVFADPAPSEMAFSGFNYLIGEANYYLVEVLHIPAFSLAFLQWFGSMLSR